MDLNLDELKRAMEKEGYVSEDDLAVTVYLALTLKKPLLVEGAPGVGKTEIAKVLGRVFDTEVIRLQCYEGLDENKALYEWNYQRQLLKIQILKDSCPHEDIEKDLFDEEYLLERPLLKAIRSDRRVVLLIDEVDKVDEPFEAFLFELLSDFQVSIPELGTLEARQIPIVVLTSNGDRELSDGLKRRCVYLYIDYPDIDKEVRILQMKVPEAGERLNRQIAAAVNYIRSNLDLRKQPSIAESLDWARALVALHADVLTVENLTRTVNLLLKNRDDRLQVLDGGVLDEIMRHALGEKAGEKGHTHCHCHGNLPASSN
ncbi:MAG: MoxR family ATPase [Peptococcaceae bacterium]|nr:MoxR family ATPase [Peptococcaceae bacterium]